MCVCVCVSFRYHCFSLGIIVSVFFVTALPLSLHPLPFLMRSLVFSRFLFSLYRAFVCCVFDGAEWLSLCVCFCAFCISCNCQIHTKEPYSTHSAIETITKTKAKNSNKPKYTKDEEEDTHYVLCIRCMFECMCVCVCILIVICFVFVFYNSFVFFLLLQISELPQAINI